MGASAATIFSPCQGIVKRSQQIRLDVAPTELSATFLCRGYKDLAPTERLPRFI
jgi:hypothetical protein